ncbi:ABC transporter permease subunit [Paraburkholderia youngii]|uniref:ABC transporter permease subunit n=1 Tax=Paraburkholderia youngii TaxID=2782701 RepID=UPI003D225757
MKSQELSSNAAVLSQPAAAPGSKALLIELMKSRAMALLLPSVILFFYFQVMSDGVFISSANASLLLRQTAAVAVVAAGVTVLIIMGEIDLSIGSTAFLAGLVAAECQMSGYGVAASVLAAIGTGVAIGLVQGIVVTRLSVPAFIVILAGLLLWRGLGLAWTNAAAIGPVDADFANLTEGRMSPLMTFGLIAAVVLLAVWSTYARYRSTKEHGAVSFGSAAAPLGLGVAAAGGLLWFYTGGGVPNAILWIGAIAVLLDIILTRAKFGRQTFLVGSNSEAAVYAGINVRRTVLIGFVVMGAICGIAGTMLIARVGTSTADSGINLELTAIAAATIGGVSLRGGIGSVRGALLGAFLLATIDNGMSLLGVSSYAQNVVKALILVFAVGLDGYLTRRRSTR